MFTGFKIAIIIISTDSKRWCVEKQIWEKYIDKHPDIDCFFIECNASSASTKNNNSSTLTFDCVECLKPGIFQKSLKCLKQLGDQYDFYIRTNLSTFVIFDSLCNYLRSIPQDRPIYTGGKHPVTIPRQKDVLLLQSKFKAFSGTSIILNRLARNMIVKYGFEKKYYESDAYDDQVFGMFFNDQNINVFSSPTSNSLYRWLYNKSFGSNIANMKKQTYSFVRLKTSNLDKYKNISNKLLAEYYNM